MNKTAMGASVVVVIVQLFVPQMNTFITATTTKRKTASARVSPFRCGCYDDDDDDDTTSNNLFLVCHVFTYYPLAHTHCVLVCLILLSFVFIYCRRSVCLGGNVCV